MSTRRDFLAASGGASLVLALDGLAPEFLVRAAADASLAAAADRNETILVVVQLSGGNDGLNTVVPYRDPLYRRHRPELGIAADRVLKIDDSLGFHPSLRGFSQLLEAGKLAVVQGVGYPNPNRSHFESMDIWHSCVRKDQPREAGWLGRFLDQQAGQPGGGKAAAGAAPGDVPAMHFGGKKQPLALAARNVRVPSVRSIDEFRLKEFAGANVADQISSLSQPRNEPGDSLLGFVQSSTSAALQASRRVRESVGQYQAGTSYPETELGQRLKTVAQLIDARLTTRIYYLELDGFDTHSQQPDAHAGLLSQLGGAVEAFIGDLEAHGHADRVLLLTFSEFGRRVQENASQGTDHGAAAPLFVAGSRVRPGLIGPHPRLDDLQDGDLKHHTDFRQVYAAVLDQWLGWDSVAVIGQAYPAIPLVRPGTATAASS